MTTLTETRQTYSDSPPENYERFFVPSIGGPVADDLISAAALQNGERVLDVACGTGVATRMATDNVGPGGFVAGLDINPAMLAVAQTISPSAIKWYEASMESMPLKDETFDVVLCQMGLQFVSDKATALGEMRRVLVPGGRVLFNVPGPIPPAFAILADALGRHVGPEAAGFARIVFSLHDAGEIESILTGAGFTAIKVGSEPKTLRLPAPRDFLWQYIYSTPLAGKVRQAGEDGRAALERDVTARWQDFADGDGMSIEVGVTTAIARR